MPSSPGYKRDYKQERATQITRGEDKDNAIRHKARRGMVKKGVVKTGDGKDVDHKKALSKGGAGLAPGNLRAMPKGKNRSFPRTRSGAMK